MRISDWSSDVCSSDLQAFLGAKRHHHFRLRVEIDHEAALVIAGLRLAQPRNPLGRRLAVRVRLSRHLAQLFDQMRRRRQVGMAHSTDAAVLAPSSRALPQSDTGRESVGGTRGQYCKRKVGEGKI